MAPFSFAPVRSASVDSQGSGFTMPSLRRSSAASASSSGSALPPPKMAASPPKKQKKRFSLKKAWKSMVKSSPNNDPNMVLNSSTPKKFLPKNWEQYGLAYSNERIDVSDPPPPPKENDVDGFLTPLEKGQYLAPVAADERERTFTANSLGLFRRNTEGLIFDNDNRVRLQILFRAILEQACELFQLPAALISLNECDKYVVLAETGLKLDNASFFQRNLAETVCAHTVLNGGKPVIINDLHSDWRFKGNPELGIDPVDPRRFYAGVPIKVTSVQSSAKVPVGTFCVLGRCPRVLTSWEYNHLLSFGDLISDQLEEYRDLKMEQNYIKMQAGAKTWQEELREAGEPQPIKRSLSPIKEYGLTAAQLKSADRSLNLAIEMMSDCSQLCFMSLIRVRTANDKRILHAKQLAATHKGNADPPIINRLFLREALLAPNGAAMVYQNPMDDELPEGVEAFPARYHSGLFVKVYDENNVGYVLSGFTENPCLILCEVEVNMVTQIARDLARIVSKFGEESEDTDEEYEDE